MEVDAEQHLIYFVIKTFTDCQTRYLPLEKLVLALVMTSQKLMHYFQTHPIAIYTKFPLKNILSKVDLSGRLSKWAIEFGQSDIKFFPRTSIKGQVLANFVAEFSPRVVSPEQSCLASTYRREESPKIVSSKSWPELGSPEVVREPPQVTKTIVVGEATRVQRLQNHLRSRVQGPHCQTLVCQQAKDPWTSHFSMTLNWLLTKSQENL